jgi:hypothetical protein
MVKMVVENEYNGTISDEVNYKTEYRKLKRKLKMLIYVSSRNPNFIRFEFQLLNYMLIKP